MPLIGLGEADRILLINILPEIKLKADKLFFIIIFFSLSFSLFANGKQDGDYSEASKLIKDKKQSQAIGEIINTLEKAPQSFNRGSDVLKKAMASQIAFEKQFTLLLNQLYKNPDDSEKILAMILKLEKLNKELDPSVIKFLDNLKTSTTYAVNRVKFNRIMDEGIALIQKGFYVDAANKFTEGYEIYYSGFKNTYAGTARLSRTEKAIADVYSDIEKFKTEERRFLNAVYSYKNNLVSAKGSLNQKTLNNLALEVEKMRGLGASIFSSGNVLMSFYEQDLKSGNYNQESFLPFAFRFTLGRTNAKEFEGVSGAFEAGLLKRLDSLEDYIFELIHQNINKAYSQFDFINKTSMDNNLKMIELCISEMDRIMKLGEAPKGVAVRFPPNQEKNKKDMEFVSDLNKNIKETRNLYEKYIEALRYGYLHDSYVPSLAYIRNQNEPELIFISKDIASLESLKGQVKSLQEDLKLLNSEKFNREKQSLSETHKLFLQNIDSLYIQKYEYFAKVKNDAGILAFEENEKEFSKIEMVYSGIQTKDKTVMYYPSKVVDLLTKSNKNLKDDIKDLGKSVQMVSASGIDFKVSASLKNNFEGIKSSESKLKKIQSALDGFLTKAKNDLLKVDLAKREADFRYNEAKRSVNSGNFAGAREHIAISQQRSNDALRLEEDPVYRQMTDERLAELGKEINRRENEVVIRDVRQYIDQAKKMYFSGNFDIAESTLITAKRRWHTTNIEENEEIVSWLSITQTAGIMKTGRTIPQSAPLYPQMTQLLNNAKQLYNEADKKMRSGQRESALKDLNQSRENIKQVLLIYPINEEAGLLNLKIDKLIDPVNFNAQLSKRVEKLRREYRKNPQNSYGELLDLYALDRRFPGIAKLKDEVEIYLGIKIIPPDTTSLEKSKEYTNFAKNIYASGDRARFPEAVERLDEAIKLDGNNYEAVVMKDRIQTALGGTAIAVLSAKNEEKYRQAVLELQKGNKFSAIALVEQLLQDPEGKRSAKVHDLKMRIDSQL